MGGHLPRGGHAPFPQIGEAVQAGTAARQHDSRPEHLLESRAQDLLPQEGEDLLRAGLDDLAQVLPPDPPLLGWRPPTPGNSTSSSRESFYFISPSPFD